MKTIFVLSFTMASLTFSYAQQGQINIEQDEKITDLIEIYKTSNESSDYYRIQVGFGSYSKAQNLQNNVEQDFPDLPSKIDFDSPTYRVRVGRFQNKLDAERKFKEVRKKYPDAMLLKPKKSTR
ncbi:MULTISPECIES: SPOR domain-containing protein [Zobellia]|uniref:SPOR domain-containing protein n=2 Tax=Zobellia TaxID=112040 RepID=A0ABS5WHT8_9FLAO|nr:MULTISPECIES: SPOR domain-containing protein [Zobellia]MBT2162521.1 SPOR domain-containing protein [Zobellia barbeyronii]MUH38986.1 SPOR domain-containing protein [Zobellia laminariae]WKX78485.1 SPOR domain-containing protein [Zobellia laminariae]